MRFIIQHSWRERSWGCEPCVGHPLGYSGSCVLPTKEPLYFIFFLQQQFIVHFWSHKFCLKAAFRNDLVYLIRAGSLSHQASNVAVSWKVIPWPEYVGVRAGGGEQGNGSATPHCKQSLCATPNCKHPSVLHPTAKTPVLHPTANTPLCYTSLPTPLSATPHCHNPSVLKTIPLCYISPPTLPLCYTSLPTPFCATPHFQGPSVLHPTANNPSVQHLTANNPSVLHLTLNTPLCYTPLPTPLCSGPTVGMDATR